MATVSFYLDKRYKRADGTFPVKLSVRFMDTSVMKSKGTWGQWLMSDAMAS